MGRVVVTEFVSLDGVAEAPGDPDFEYPSWTFDFDQGADGEQFKVDETLAADALLLGRTTYEGFAAAWPAEEGELADKLNGMPKYVLSSTLTDPKWTNTRVLTGDLAEVTAQVKAEVAGEISVAGSLQLAQGLFALDLVDEVRLMTFPVILGTGKRLFASTPDKSVWTLTTARAVGEGVLVTVFQRRR